MNAEVNGAYRWERQHGEGLTTLTALCENCGRPRPDVHHQVCNVRHPDGRLKAEALMLAVATYGSCQDCGASAVRLVTHADEPAWFEIFKLGVDEREFRLAFS